MDCSTRQGEGKTGDYEGCGVAIEWRRCFDGGDGSEFRWRSMDSEGDVVAASGVDELMVAAGWMIWWLQGVLAAGFSGGSDVAEVIGGGDSVMVGDSGVG
ncbi:hypothetical protein ACFE04_023584 [Oxalis oulophora]